MIKTISMSIAIFLAAWLWVGCSDSVSEGCKTSADCPDGQLCDTDTGDCRAPLTCAEVDCAAHQLCQEASAGADATCLEACDDGYTWNAQAQTCDSHAATCDPEAPGSILQQCSDLGRECLEETPGQAGCGDCLLASQVLDPDTGGCRDPIKCDSIECNSDQVCVEGPGRDAYCSSDCSGPNGEQGLISDDGICILCPLCDEPASGEDGPYLDSLTRNGDCICKTRPNYYWSLAPIGVEPCDADGDGWVRIGAQTSIDHDDVVISSNARCSLRRSEAFLLENEAGETLRLALAEPVAMYESKRNDDQSEIDDDPSAPAFFDGRSPQAAELNGLTKACVSGLADYNENGLADVNEWHQMTPPASMNPAYMLFVDFSYFIELHRGWYEPGAAESTSCVAPAECPGHQVCEVITGQCQAPGVYRIREKSRAADAVSGLAVALVQDEADPNKGPYWRSCTRKLDSGYAGASSKQGMDYGRFSWNQDELETNWHGMNHHSQFKCIKLSADPDQPNEVERTELGTMGYELNHCVATGSSGTSPGVDARNPSDPDFSCLPLSGEQVADLDNGDVRWAVQDYLRYEANECDAGTPEYDCVDNYIRGCVNECAELVESCPTCSQTREACPGYQDDPVKGQCADIESDFGRLLCGCADHFGGEQCQLACPDTDLMKDPAFTTFDFDKETRSGYWMCGHITTTTYPAGDPVLTGANSSNEIYTLRGEVPITPVSDTRLEGGGYVVDTRAKDNDGREEKQKSGYTIRPAGGSYRIR